MDLIFWRHAQAFDLESDQLDLDRALTAEGRRQALGVAQWLHLRLPADAVLLCSPARRCRETLDVLSRHYNVCEDVGPDGSVTTLLAATGWPDQKATVLVVGHQPVIGRAIARLLCGSEQDWSVRKGSVWWLRSRERNGLAQTALRAVVHPGML